MIDCDMPPPGAADRCRAIAPATLAILHFPKMGETPERDRAMRLLVIEDDVNIANLITDSLRAEGHRADAVTTAGDGYYAARQVGYDVLIVDRALPDEDGLSLLKRLRSAGVASPILMLTARGAVDDRVAGLSAGADDYLVKPFAMPELKARILALSRRPPKLNNRQLQVGKLTFDLEKREASVDGRRLQLSRRELGLLELFVQRVDHILPKRQIQDSLYGFDDELASNAVEVHIHHLRKLLAKVGSGVRIETRRGIGYCLSLGEQADRRDADIAERAVAFQKQAFVERVQRDRDRISGLLRKLPEVTGARAAGVILTEIEEIAHGLAGAAGVFGFSAAGEAALAVEDAIRARHGGCADTLLPMMASFLEQLDQVTA